MKTLFQTIVEYFIQKERVIKTDEEQKIIELKIGLEHRPSPVTVRISIIEEYQYIEIKCLDYFNVLEGKRDVAHKFCSRMNNLYVQAKFYVKEDSDEILVTHDYMYNVEKQAGNIAQEVFDLTMIIANICDDSYYIVVDTFFSCKAGISMNSKETQKRVFQNGTYKKNLSGEWIEEVNDNNTIVFCTHNPGKIQSANKYFEGVVQFETVDYDIPEIRGSIEEIAIAKVKDAFKRIGKPTIAMDAGFDIPALNHYPGSYVNHMLETIGIDGVLKLMSENEVRECEFTQCLAYYDGTGEPIVFHGSHKGILSNEKRGIISADDWSDLSLIFIPAEEISGKKRTLAELNHEERVELTRRNDNVSHSAFNAFKEWFIQKKLAMVTVMADKI